jgi:hypothetical protein
MSDIPITDSVAPQYMRALERANKIRLARAEIKRAVALGEVDVAEVILDCPRAAESMSVADLLMSQPRWGQTRCRKFLRQIAMSEKKTIGSMTERQRRTLVAYLGERSKAAQLVDRLVEPRKDQTDSWDELAALVRRQDEISIELAGLTVRRDELIRSLSDAGASRRSVAEGASLTVGRVQQIVDEAKPTTSRKPDVSPSYALT